MSSTRNIFFIQNSTVLSRGYYSNNNHCLLFIHNVPEASASLKTSAMVAAAVNFCTFEINGRIYF